MDKNRPFEYRRNGTFFEYMTPESLGRMNPELRVIQERVEERFRALEAKHSRAELEAMYEADKAATRTGRAHEERMKAAPEKRFVGEWDMVLGIADRESWNLKQLKASLAGCVARHLGQDDARGRDRVMNIFAQHGGKATRRATVSLLCERVSTSEGFKWLAHRAGQYAAGGVRHV